MLAASRVIVTIPPPPQVPTGGCGNCWAAGYCAVYSPANTQVPANCPLGLGPEPGSAPTPEPPRALKPPLPPAGIGRGRRRVAGVGSYAALAAG